MKKIFVVLILYAFFPCFAADSINDGVIYGHTGSQLNSASQMELQTIQQQNSILHIQEGIKANQEQINSRLNAKTQTQTSTAKMQTTSANPNTNNQPVNINTRIPHVYTYTYADKKTEGATVNVTNNTYVQSPSENSVEQTTSETVETQEEKDEKERQALRKKYSSILSNATMSNEKMCEKMAAYYTAVSSEELDRVLNHILRLNCNICKLRPGCINQYDYVLY